MAHEGPPIEWRAFEQAGRDGRLMELLTKLPRERWTERDIFANTLLHLACLGPNLAAVVALLQSGLVDVDARTNGECTPAHYAAAYKASLVLTVLCAAGADLRARNGDFLSPMDYALMYPNTKGGKAVRVLVANGVRLSTASKGRRRFITPKLEAFERGVLRCRAVVVAMLRVKRASGGRLVRWDKFLLAEIAVCMWATRDDKGWMTA